MTSPLPNSPDLAVRLGMILQGLRVVIAQGGARPGPFAPLAATARLVLFWNWIGRVARRFEAILARPARIRRTGNPPAAAATHRPRSIPPAGPTLPPGWHWLLRAIPGHRLPGCAEQLRHLLRDPAMAELIATDPRAARLLRPLCRRLGIRSEPDLPAGLFLPRRPGRRRPAPPPPAVAEGPATASVPSRFPRPPRKQYPHLPDLGARWPAPAPGRRSRLRRASRDGPD